MGKRTRSPRAPSTLESGLAFGGMNPWWGTGEVDAPTKERTLARLLAPRLLEDEPRRFHVVYGPRRTGKSTALQQTVRSLLAKGIPPRRILWLDMSHPLLLQAGLGILSASVKSLTKEVGSPIFAFIDEIAYAPQWDLWLKTAYDQGLPVRVVATSSATAALKAGHGDSGVGRWEAHPLPPLTLGECLDLAGDGAPRVSAPSLSSAIAEASEVPAETSTLRDVLIHVGGFPEHVLHSSAQNVLVRAQRDLRANAVERTIHQDMPQVFGIDDTMAVFRLLHVLAAQVGEIFSPATCADTVHVSHATAERYLGFLERSYLVFTVPNWSPRETNVQRRGRKVYFFDVAVRNATLLKGLAVFADSIEMGHLRENLVAQHLKALSDVELVRLYYWRDRVGGTDLEVDFVYDHPSDPCAFEVGARKHSRVGLRGLIARRPDLRGRSWVVVEQGEFKPADASPDGIGQVPLDRLLLAVSARTARVQAEIFGATET